VRKYNILITYTLITIAHGTSFLLYILLSVYISISYLIFPIPTAAVSAATRFLLSIYFYFWTVCTSLVICALYIDVQDLSYKNASSTCRQYNICCCCQRTVFRFDCRDRRLAQNGGSAISPVFTYTIYINYTYLHSPHASVLPSSPSPLNRTCHPPKLNLCTFWLFSAYTWPRIMYKKNQSETMNRLDDYDVRVHTTYFPLSCFIRLLLFYIIIIYFTFPPAVRSSFLQNWPPPSCKYKIRR